MAGEKRFFLYARKSTDVEDKQVRSIDAQLAELHAFAKTSGLAVADVIVERESAKTPGRRKAFNAMLDRIERGEANGILAWHPDRLARNMTDGGRIIDLIDTGRIAALSFPTFWFDTTPQGTLMLSFAFSQSKYYIDSMAENTKRGFREKIRRGEYPGLAPIGYLNDRRVKRIVPDPDRAPVVRQVFERYATGDETLDSMRKFLAQNGVVSRTGKNYINGAVSHLLRNPIYYGQFRYAGEVYDGIHEPIVTKALFDRVQRVIKGRWKWSPGPGPKVPKAFLGLLRCEDCGGAITAEVQKGHTYYRCTKKNREARWCAQPYVREEALDAQITGLLGRHALRADWADAMLAEIDAEARQARGDTASALAEKRRLIDGIDAKINRLLDLRLEGEIAPKSYSERKLELMGQRKAIEEQMALLAKGKKPWLEPMREWVSEARNLATIARTGALTDKKVLARKIFGSNLSLKSKKVSGEALKPWCFLADNQFTHVTCSDPLVGSNPGACVPLLEAVRSFFKDSAGG